MKWTDSSLALFKEILTGAAHDESAWVSLGALAWTDTVGNPWKRRLGRWAHRCLVRRGWALIKQKPFDPRARDKGWDWPLVGYTMVGRQRLNHLQACLETIHRESVPGNLIETGVWRGGSCMLMKAMLQAHGDDQRIVYLADSFAGLPPPKNKADGWDLSNNPYLQVSAAQVRRNFERFELWDDRVQFIEGWFEDTLAQTPTGPLAVLRLDGDLYESTHVALAALYDRVSPHGFVIVDDYHGWPGCRRAVDEFLAARHPTLTVTEIDGMAVCWRKPSMGESGA